MASDLNIDINRAWSGDDADFESIDDDHYFTDDAAENTAAGDIFENEVMVLSSDGEDIIDDEHQEDQQEDQQDHQLLDLNLEPHIFDLNLDPTDNAHQQQIPPNQQAHQEVNNQDQQPPQSQQQQGQSRRGVCHHQRKRKRLSSDDRYQILMFLLNKANSGVIKRGTITDVAKHFSLSNRTISRIWKKARQQKANQQNYNMSTMMHNSGRKRSQVNLDDIIALSMGQRTCIRDLAQMLNVSKTTVHRMIKRGLIRPHTNALHPSMTEANKITRLEWILNLLIGDSAETRSKYFPMWDFVHIDEKWFYMTKKTRVYLAQNEKGKHRSAQSQKFIPKVMFTAAVARPRYNAEGECIFDGKIGIFPFTYEEPAKRKSKNREKGTMITKVVESVNKDVTRRMLIDQIVPAIKAKWPQDGASRTIFIQQDNARAHITQDDPEWQQVYKQDGFTFILVQQPPNSPDLNILDLGFFRSIQSLMHKKMPENPEKLLQAVKDAFDELEPSTLANVWLTYQYVMNEVLKVKGGNDYALPHVNKAKLEAEGRLFNQVRSPIWAVIQAWDIVTGNGEDVGLNNNDASTSNQNNASTSNM